MRPQDAHVPEERSTHVQTRKAYQKPEVQIYGDLTELTQSMTGSKTNDGAGHPNMHYTS